MYTDVALGMSGQESGSIRFFCVQALGIMLEDAVQELWRCWLRRRQKIMNKEVRVGKWEKGAGYLWTLAFIVWSTPAWGYPAIRRQTGKANDAILPFSVLRTMTGRSYEL